MKTPYRYSVKNDAGLWYTVNNNIVDTQATPFYFYGYIANWNELGLRDSRNMRMAGFFRNRTSEIQFVKDLALIMRHSKYRRGVNKALTIYIDRLNLTTQDYEPDGSSSINLAQSRDELNQFAAYMAEAGLPELIKTYEDTKYSIPVTGTDVVNVKMLPLKIKGRCVFVSVAPTAESPVVPNRPTAEFNMPGYAKKDEIVYEVLESPTLRPVDYFDVMETNLKTPGGSLTNNVFEFGQPYQQWGDLSTGIRKLVTSTVTVVDFLLKSNIILYEVRIRGILNVYLKNTHSTSPVNFRFRLYETIYSTGATTLISSSTQVVTLAASSDGTFSFDLSALNAQLISSNYVMPADAVLYLTLHNDTPSITQVEWMAEGGMPLTIDFKHYTSEYTRKGFNAYNLMQKILDKITGGGIPFVSNLLTAAISYEQGIDCRPDKLLITSSQCLRNVTNPVINISLKELLTSLQVWLGCGLTVERDSTGAYTAVRVEKWDYFYKEEVSFGVPNTIADFERVSDWYIEPAEEMVFSELKIGFEPAETDEINIVDDVHAAHVYTSSYTKSQQSMDMISPIAACCFAVHKEFLDSATSKDRTFRDNNKSYVIQYSPTHTAGVHNALYSTEISSSALQTGITDPARLLNPGLTPKRCLLRNAYYVLSHIPYTGDLITDNYKLKFQSTERNSQYYSRIATLLGAGEGSDIDINDMALLHGQSRIFWPEYLYWTAPSKNNYKQLWEDNRFGIFRVTLPIPGVNSPVLKAFPIESADWTAQNDEYDFKGLLTAGTDLSVLVR